MNSSESLPVLFLLGTEREDLEDEGGVGVENSYRVEPDPGPAISVTGEFMRIIDPGSGDVAALDGMDAPAPEPRLERTFDRLREGRTSSRVAVQERIRGARRIAELADTMVRYRCRGEARTSGGQTFAIRAFDHVLGAGVRWELKGRFCPAPFTIEVRGYNCVFEIPIEHATIEQGMLVTPLPEELTRLRLRWQRRVPAPRGFAVSFPHPRRSEARVSRYLHDISHEGFSFFLTPGEQFLRPGQMLTDVEVRDGGVVVARLDAEVRFVTPGSVDRPAICGLKLGESAGQCASWAELVNEILNPTTSAGSRWSEATWRLYERSGYFSLSGKDPDEFVPLRPAFERASRLLAAAPDIGYQVVWPNPDGEVQAALSVLNVYQGSWFGYQMAKLRGDTSDGISGRKVLRDIHLRAYEHAQHNPDIRWVVGYTQVHRVWSRLVHHDLPQRYLDSGLADIVRFQALEYRTKARPQPVVQGTSVSPASPSEVTQLLEHLGRTRSRPYVQSLDLVPSRVDLGAVKQKWDRGGLSRDRVILVARRDGHPVAAAVAELAEDGLHLFRLLDCVRVYALAPGGDASFPALLEAAREWFRANGKPRFVLFLERAADQGARPSAELAFEADDLGFADMTILSADLLPELLEHLCEATAPKKFIPDTGRHYTAEAAPARHLI